MHRNLPKEDLEGGSSITENFSRGTSEMLHSKGGQLLDRLNGAGTRGGAEERRNMAITQTPLCHRADTSIDSHPILTSE